MYNKEGGIKTKRKKGNQTGQVFCFCSAAIKLNNQRVKYESLLLFPYLFESILKVKVEFILVHKIRNQEVHQFENVLASQANSCLTPVKFITARSN